MVKKLKGARGILCGLLVAATFLAGANVLAAELKGTMADGLRSDLMQADVQSTDDLKKNDYIYLSDLTYDNSSYAGYKTIMKDTNVNGGTIKLRKDGEVVQYLRGMAIHAKGQLVYDLSEYTSEYTRLLADVGVDADQPADKGSVKVIISTSEDGQKWEELHHVGGKDHVLNSAENCYSIDLNIQGKKYIKFFIEDHNGNANDHLMLADAKIAKDGYQAKSEIFSKIQPLAEYNKTIMQGGSLNDIDKMYESHKEDILKRAFVQKLGYWSIQNYYNFDKEGSQRVLDWILEDEERMKEVIEVGEIKDGVKFLQILSSLLEKYNNFEGDKEDVYTKMAIALAAANTSDVMASPFSFALLSPNYDLMKRFEHLKDYYDKNKMPEEFASYKIPQMRMVVQDPVWEEDMDWLYAKTHKWGTTYNQFDGGSWWLAYRRPNYANEKYYNLEKIKENKYDVNHRLETYEVPFGVDNKVHYWMAFSEGGICWNTSRMGQGVYRVAGLPATGGYQPGHEVFVYYNKNSDGVWTWGMGNNVYGWGRSSTTWTGGYQYRLLLGWGNEEYTLKDIVGGKSWANNMGYILLAQANIDQYETYQKGLLYGSIADMYDSLEEKAKVYEKALEASNYMNLDYYDALIDIYEEMEEKEAATAETNEDRWYNLAGHIVDSYTYFPQTMYDLLEPGEGRGSGVSAAWKGVKSHITKSEHLADISIRERGALEKAAALTVEDKKDHPQWSEIKSIASLILGLESEPIATFSFDGKNAGKVVVSDSYRVKWGYCINDKKCENPARGTTEEKSMQLTPEELASINPDPEKLSDKEQEIFISLKIEGTNTPYIINIEPGYVTNVYQNDEEKRLVGNTGNLEWRISKSQEFGDDWTFKDEEYPDGKEWKLYSEEAPDLTGAYKVVEVRPRAHENYRIGEVKTYQFKDESYLAGMLPDSNQKAEIYIPSSMMRIYDVSSEATERNYGANNLIDGDINTSYYSDWEGNDNKRYVIIELEQPMVISRVKYFTDTWMSYGYRGTKCDRNNGSEGSDWDSMTLCSEKGTILGGKILGSNTPENEDSWEEIVGDLSKSASGKSVMEDHKLKPKPDSDNNELKVEYTSNNTTKYKYIKIVSTSGYEDSGGKTWLSGNMIQLFTQMGGDDLQPTASIEYTTTDLTNGDVTARVVNVTPLGTKVKADDNCTTDSGSPVKASEDGKSYTFSDNGECTFHLEYQRMSWGDLGSDEEEAASTEENVVGTADETEPMAVVEGSKVFRNDVKATVSNISKNAPKPAIKWSDNKEGGITNQTVSVDLEFDDKTPVLVYNNGIVSLNEKGQPVRDLDGTMINKFMKFKVQDPNAVGEEAELIDAMIDPTIDTSEEGSTNVIQRFSDVFHYDFMTNGEQLIQYIDQAGNKGEVELKVDNIDNIPPVAIVDYSTSTLTEEPVEATVKFYGEEPDGTNAEEQKEEDGVKITAIADKNAKDKEKAKAATDPLKTEFASVAAGSHVITFTGNGELTITYEDAAGNIGETEAKVDWFADKGSILESTDENVKVEKTEGKKPRVKLQPGMTVGTLSEKLRSDYTSAVNILDSQEASLDIESNRDRLVGTGMKAGVFGNNYTIIVEKDANGDGVVDIEDVKRTHWHYVEKEQFADPLHEAVDFDNDGTVSLKDVAKLHHEVEEGAGSEAMAVNADEVVELGEVQANGQAGADGENGEDGEGESGDGEIKVGDTVSVKINLSNPGELNALAGKVQTSGNLKFVGCEEGSDGWIVTCNTDNGKIVASHHEISNRDNLPVTLKFETTEAGSASVELDEVKLASGTGDERSVSNTQPIEFAVASKQTTPNPGPGGNEGTGPGGNQGGDTGNNQGGNQNQGGNSGNNGNNNGSTGNNGNNGNPGNSGNNNNGNSSNNGGSNNGSNNNDNHSGVTGGNQNSNGGTSANSGGYIEYYAGSSSNSGTNNGVVSLALVGDGEEANGNGNGDTIDGVENGNEKDDNASSQEDSSVETESQDDFIEESNTDSEKNNLIVPIIIIVVIVAGALVLFAYAKRKQD